MWTENNAIPRNTIGTNQHQFCWLKHAWLTATAVEKKKQSGRLWRGILFHIQWNVNIRLHKLTTRRQIHAAPLFITLH